jgi:thiol-disulfide isomerase/thioredoxin
MNLLPLLVGTLLASPAPVAPRTYLNVGDPAPALRPAEWLKGTPTTRFQKGKVYVVEFWATWCTPCKENIPHLTELAKKYEGQVSINGISIFENNDPKSSAYLKKVRAFVASQGPRMEYNVAVDGPAGTVGKTWMKAADEGGLPTTFVVNREGLIAWIGHPKDLETTLTQVLNGTYDLAAARERRAKDVEVVRPIHEAMESKAYAKAVELIDAAIAKKPEEERLYAYDRLVALYHAAPKKAQEESERILTESNGDIGAYRMISSIFASQKDLSRPSYEYGKATIAKALEKDEMTYLFLAMGAEVNASLGDLAGAVTMQERAVAVAEKDSHAPAEFVDFLRKNLEGFRTKAAAKKTPSRA